MLNELILAIAYAIRSANIAAIHALLMYFIGCDILPPESTVYIWVMPFNAHR